MRKYDVILDVNEKSVNVDGREYLTFYIAGGDEGKLQRYYDTLQAFEEVPGCENCRSTLLLCDYHKKMASGELW